MQNFVGMAIRQNKYNLLSMRNSVIAVLYHCTNFPYEVTCHQFCLKGKKCDQDRYRLKFLSVQKKQRSRKKEQFYPQKMRNRSNCEISYFTEKENRQIVHVCKDTFLKCLHVGKTRVQNIAKHFFKHGNPRKENRW